LKRPAAVIGPLQPELLHALIFCFVESELNQLDGLRLVEVNPYRLLATRRRSPSAPTWSSHFSFCYALDEEPERPWPPGSTQEFRLQPGCLNMRPRRNEAGFLDPLPQQ